MTGETSLLVISAEKCWSPMRTFSPLPFALHFFLYLIDRISFSYSSSSFLAVSLSFKAAHSAGQLQRVLLSLVCRPSVFWQGQRDEFTPVPLEGPAPGLCSSTSCCSQWLTSLKMQRVLAGLRISVFVWVREQMARGRKGMGEKPIP